MAKTAQKACLTCKQRRTFCDRATPICTQCSQSKRKCKGYALQLSWPRPGDGKRTIVTKQAVFENVHRFRPHLHFVHVTHRDVAMHQSLLQLTPIDRPSMHIPLPWNPFPIEVGDKDLFSYFQYAASKSLTVLGHDPAQLGSILMRIAVSGKTISGTAVLQSLLALASIHRAGLHPQAMKLKISSLNALATASKTDLCAEELIRHIAADMLLCSFEVHQASCASDEWTWYIAGIKRILNNPSLKIYHGSKDLAVLTDWVYYHDVLARFTLRHWPRGRVECSSVPEITSTANLTFPQIPYSRPGTPLGSLELLSLFCDTVSKRPIEPASPQETAEYKTFFNLLEWQLSTMVLPSTPDVTLETAKIAELYKIVTLIYIHRVAENLFEQAEKIQQCTDRGFALLEKLDSCERQFPMYILGCEARSDEQRAIILDVMDRTEMKVSSRSLNHVRLMVQAHWAQDDLAEWKLDYWQKLTNIISACSILPSLV